MWLARVIASEVEKIPKLGQAKVESGQPIVALWSIGQETTLNKSRENVRHSKNRSTKALDVMLIIPSPKARSFWRWPAAIGIQVEIFVTCG